MRDFMEGALTNKPSKQTQGGSPSDPSPRESPFKTSGSTGSNGQNSSSLTGSQGGPPSQTHGGIKNAGQKDGVSSQDESPFKTGGVGGSGKGSSTVTTGAPPLSQKQGKAAWSFGPLCAALCVKWFCNQNRHCLTLGLKYFLRFFAFLLDRCQLCY